jgi:hypothetical protein
MHTPNIPQKTLPHQFMVCDDGTLNRVVKVDGGLSLVEVRGNYKRHHREITTVADLKACLRAGKYAWPGGYACYFITSDGAVLSFEAVRQELANVMDAIRNNLRDGWKVVGMGCTADCDETPVCDHTGKEID